MFIKKHNGNEHNGCYGKTGSGLMSTPQRHLTMTKLESCVFGTCLIKSDALWGLGNVAVFIQQLRKKHNFHFLCPLLGRCMPPLFVYFGKEASQASWEWTEAWQLPTVPFNRLQAARPGLDHLKQHGGELLSDSLRDQLRKSLHLFYTKCKVNIMKSILICTYWNEELRESKHCLECAEGHRKGLMGCGWLESDPFSKSLLLFPSRLCFKTGKLLAFEKYPFPICHAAAPVVITSPLPPALVERR